MKVSLARAPHRDHPTYYYAGGRSAKDGYVEASTFGRLWEEGDKSEIDTMRARVQSYVDGEEQFDSRRCRRYRGRLQRR